MNMSPVVLINQWICLTNSIGRSIDVSNKSEAQIVSAVKTKVSNGSCRRIINNKLVATNGDGMK